MLSNRGKCKTAVRYASTSNINIEVSSVLHLTGYPHVQPSPGSIIINSTGQDVSCNNSCPWSVPLLTKNTTVKA